MSIKKIEKTACIGAGLIGSSWATIFSKEGYPVNLYDVNKEQLELSQKKVEANFKVYVDNKVLTNTAAEEAMKRISYIDDLEKTLKNVQFIQECGYENLETKRAILAEVDKYNPTALFGSSTSSLNISDISRDSKHPERCIGAHPYNPPHLMPFVEITKWEKTDEKYVEIAYNFYKSIKKEPVVLLKESKGFIANRLQAAYVKAAIKIVMEGVCTIPDLDKASVYALGVRYAIIGPFLNGELNGGDGGITEYFRKYGSSFGVSTEFMEKIAPEGIEQEKLQRQPGTGNTREEIIAYRDKMLIEILKLHKKI